MKIAVIGSGISGMTVAHALSEFHELTLFEASDRLGGHTATIDVKHNAQVIPIDTGFIVFNDRTYPNFITLMDELGVQSQPSCMSFSVSDKLNNLEYAGTNLNTIFSQRLNLLKPKFLRMLKDIVRFNRTAGRHMKLDAAQRAMNLDQYLDYHDYSREFKEQYLVPMSAAIWSSSSDGMLKFPVELLVRFFTNHGLMSFYNRPQWRVIQGGSKQYIKPLIDRYKDNIRINSSVKSVSRIYNSSGQQKILINSKHGDEYFDQVVFACHSDQALNILQDPTAEEKSILGAIPYRRNEVVLHSDTSLMPKNKRCWSSWNVRLDERGGALTYDMNTLQGLECEDNFLVTLNSNGHIKPEKIIDTFKYDHPIFNTDTAKAQNNWFKINGVASTWYCGAYWRNGFHEDGVWSALRVAKEITNSSSDIIQAA